MKKLLYLFMLVGSISVFSSCDNKTEEAHENAEEQADDVDNAGAEEQHDAQE